MYSLYTIKGVYVKHKYQKFLKTLNSDIKELNTKIPIESQVNGETDSNSMVYTSIPATNITIISAYAINYPIIPCVTGSSYWAFKVYDIATGQPVGSGVSVLIYYKYIQ